MNKQQRRIIKLTKVLYKLQTLNNPKFHGSYNTHYKACKWLYKHMDNKEYEDTIAWCKYALEKSEKK